MPMGCRSGWRSPESGGGMAICWGTRMRTSRRRTTAGFRSWSRMRSNKSYCRQKLIFTVDKALRWQPHYGERRWIRIRSGSVKQAKCAILIALGMSLMAASAAAQQLRSPWDSAVKVTNAPYRCPQPVHLSPDLTTEGFYGDSKGSVIDPVKMKA